MEESDTVTAKTKTTGMMHAGRSSNLWTVVYLTSMSLRIIYMCIGSVHWGVISPTVASAQ